ncbi:MAG: anti-sigma factor family protein [Nocardioidaceae bacterium]
MDPGVQHTDIGAYALGSLEVDDRRRFEAHVAHCPRCQAELSELSPVAAALRSVPPEIAASMEPATAVDPPPPQLVDLVRWRAAKDRRRRATSWSAPPYSKTPPGIRSRSQPTTPRSSRTKRASCRRRSSSGRRPIPRPA